MHFPESATYTSPMGRAVSISRITPPGAPDTTTMVEVKYHRGGKGREVWLPDVQRCWYRVAQVVDHFMHDRSSLGREIKRPTHSFGR